MDLSTHAAVVNCEAYRDGRKIAHFDIDKVGDFLGDPDCFVWIGLAGPDSIAMQALQSAFGLHELAVEDAQGAHERPKLEEYGDTLFMVMHTATLDGGAIIYGETHVFLGPRFIITVRHGASAGYAKLRERKESVPEKLASGPGYVLYSIIDFIVDQYQPCIDHLQSRFQHYELQLFQPSLSEDKLQDFYQLKTELLKLDAAVNPLHDICTQLIRFHGDIVPKENRIYYRDILDHVKRVTHTAGQMRELVNSAMQVALGQISIRQNEVVKRLAAWAAILAVPTMVFSLYGMNFEFMPELKWRGSYPAVIVVIIAGCYWLHRRLKREGWL
ncbi:MAG: magnesium and cobalt transport protein CorA [Burkholderiales bacterium]|uniref:Magnesium and cobalt transport protein CorA n=1 Tax=Janthinobacterium tructae TaxID=2590869 RepID=A0A4Y6R9B6_9BURK|nr:magnesium and cobalt transport protein CorA [Janthinobacterium tructae]MBH1984086.1 magnesium and cobalt transport protein CorA [Burkholderiales bacterium]MBH2072266.1 magnesium and cobalt transport protein CorA [Burkholderiales bacterium]QDG69532.1 magnesium and cobalt transport protein CorA [Janthinobacterium tructae]